MMKECLGKYCSIWRGNCNSCATIEILGSDRSSLILKGYKNRLVYTYFQVCCCIKAV